MPCFICTIEGSPRQPLHGAHRRGRQVCLRGAAALRRVMPISLLDAYQSACSPELGVLAVKIDVDRLPHPIKDRIFEDNPLDSSLVQREAFDVGNVGSAREGHVSER